MIALVKNSQSDLLIVTMEADPLPHGGKDNLEDATGFIRPNALRLGMHSSGNGTGNLSKSD
ncbi:MAG: hypothetical protein HY735_19935 [Verrucomicrobia bacterium]|nr:hypothetical protein [Verrucomicrobiota bacterium]